MRLVFGEFPVAYEGYRFPYQVLAVKGKKDNLAQIYYGGWLPFRSKRDWFYLCRSTRVRLNEFELSSENRRILKKIEEVSFAVIPTGQFDYTPVIQKFCKRFADEKFGKGVMPVAAIRKVLSGSGNCTHVMVFRSNEAGDVGFVGIVTHGHFLHYAHPFYDLDGDANLGMGMMVRAVQWAKDQNKQFIYLGTCYGEAALYKTQFKGFEFFNGFNWSDDVGELKYLIRRSSESYLLQDEVYRERFVEGEWSESLRDKGVNVGLK
jgi:hypothetical protein